MPQASSAATRHGLRPMASREGVQWSGCPLAARAATQGVAAAFPNSGPRSQLSQMSAHCTAFCSVNAPQGNQPHFALKKPKKKEINYHVLITRVSLDIPTRLQMGKLPERTLKHCRSALHLIRYEHLNESPGEDRTARYFNTQPSQATAANA